MMIKRGEIYIVNLDPVLKQEVGKRRACIIIQDDIATENSDSVIVLPLSQKRRIPSIIHIKVPAEECGLKRDSFILCNHIRAINKKRILHFIGILPEKHLHSVEEGIKAILSI